MEGDGNSSHDSQRRAVRILLDIDLNKLPEPEPEDEQQLPQNDAPKVIHDLEEENPKVDMLVKSNKLARAGKDLEVRDAKIRGDTGLNLNLPLVDNKKDEVDSNRSAEVSRAGARQELVGPGNKRARTDTTQANDGISSPGGAPSSSSNEERCVPPKIKWKAQDMAGGIAEQRPSPPEEEKQNP